MNRLKCDGELYINQLTNEMGTPLSLSGPHDYRFIFKIDEWFDQWLYILDSHELVNNQLEDYAELCKGVQCIKKYHSCSNKHSIYHIRLLKLYLYANNHEDKSAKHNPNLHIA